MRVVGTALAGLLASAGAAHAALTNGQVFYTSFDNTSGSVAPDTAGTNNYATFMSGGAAASYNLVTGAFGKAASYDVASSQYSTINSPSELNTGSALTISLWVYIPSTFAPSGTAPIFDSSQDSYNVYMNNANTLSFKIITGGSGNGQLKEYFDLSLTGRKDQWLHVVATYDNAAQAASFTLNNTTAATARSPGVQLNSTSTAAGEPLSGSIPTQTPYLASANGTAGAFTGSIDDVAIWNRALTPAELSFIQANPAPEPAAMSLIGAAGLLLMRRQRRRRAV